MRIQAVIPLNICSKNNNQHKSSQRNNIQNKAYNPIAYNDLAFTARVCWSPQEFYSLPFNKNGMPETMKQYINADFEDRQHMRPQDVMSLVFDDINETKNLEQVKRIFPDEPLFKDLTDKPNKEARTGILAEIDLMREEGKSLFKNGKDNLGHYILKKIYVEGKTLKEINEDFKKDVSVHYNGLSDITYDTKDAFGIKFPNRSFWKSFTYNRDNFKVVHKPRKPIENHRGSIKPKTTFVVTQKNRFESVKEWEVERLTDAMTKGNGSISETKKQLKKSSVRDESSLNFVAKYMGEINSVVLEKLHVSPEMREFFENYDGLSKSQKQKLDAYWQNPETRELRSKVMSSTIRFFFDVYGVDGQNEEFKELLDYAHSIKPNRLAKIEQHNKIQAEYDKMFEELESQKPVDAESVKQSAEEILENEAKKLGAKIYEFKTDKGDVKIVSNLKADFKEMISEKLFYMPKQYTEKFINFVMENKTLKDSYFLSSLLEHRGIELPNDERIMPKEKVDDITLKLYSDFVQINKKESRAAKQAIIDGFVSSLDAKEMTPKIFAVDPFDFAAILNELPEGISELIKENTSLINSKFSEYKKLLTPSENRKITLKIVDLLRRYNVQNSNIPSNSFFNGMEAAIESIGYFVKNNESSGFKSVISEYLKDFGSSAKVLLDKNYTDIFKLSELEFIMLSFANEETNKFFHYATLDTEGLRAMKMRAPELFRRLMK